MIAAASAVLVLAQIGLLAPLPEPPPAPKPNFLVILIDDIGLDQLSCYEGVNAYLDAGNDYPYAYTPAIQSLADDGMMFTQARAYPNCSPTRAAIQSGYYGLRTGCGTFLRGLRQGNPTTSPSFNEFNVPPALVVPETLAEMLKTNGYATGLFGKLHLGLERDMDGGHGDHYARKVLKYDEFHGVARNLATEPHPDTGGIPIGFVAHTLYYWITSTPSATTREVINGYYITTKQREATRDWILANDDGPFFAFLNFSDIHSPPQWPPDAFNGDSHGFGDWSGRPECKTAFTGCDSDMDGCTSFPDEIFFNTRIRAKIEYVDSAIDNLLQAIPPAVLDNTYIFVLGDNGTQGTVANIDDDEVRYPDGYMHGPADKTCFDMSPYVSNRMKGTAFAAGVRVPLIVKGPGIEAGSMSPALVDVVDFFETLRDLAQGQGYNPALGSGNDSISFADVLRGVTGVNTHARQASHTGRFEPNGDYPSTQITKESQYYLRRDDCGNLWKLVQILGETDRFYEVRGDPWESVDLTPAHCMYPVLRAEFDQLIMDQTMTQIGATVPLACMTCP